MPEDRVTVVVITRNRRLELRPHPAAAGRLPEDPHVVVMDNGSADGTASMLRRDFPAVQSLALLPVGTDVAGPALLSFWRGRRS